jgi:steroid delta-isomerase-like uncharacterized protein
MDHTNVIHRMAETVRRRDADAMAALYTPDATVHHPLYPEPARGQDAIRASQRELFDAIADVEVDVLAVLTGQNTCAAEVVIKATHSGTLDVGGVIAATGRRVEVQEVWVFDLDSNGLIAEERDYLDTAALLAQLGADRQPQEATEASE